MPPSKTLTNLSRFVVHLWKGAPTRSYAAAVRAEPAPIVRVKMQPTVEVVGEILDRIVADLGEDSGKEGRGECLHAQTLGSARTVEYLRRKAR